MSDRTKEYRRKMKEKGLVQVRIWVEKEDEKFVKFVAKFCREGRNKKTKKRYGRPAKPNQIKLAQDIAAKNGLTEPKHLYDYHISLAAWIWRYRGGSNF
jgi:hypothetical protein